MSTTERGPRSPEEMLMQIPQGMWVAQCAATAAKLKLQLALWRPCFPSTRPTIKLITIRRRRIVERREDHAPAYGLEPTRDAALQAFTRSWHKE